MSVTSFLRSRYPRRIRVWRLRPGMWVVNVGTLVFAHDSWSGAMQAADEWAGWRPPILGSTTKRPRPTSR
jgi:hypothetical protein